MWYNNSSFNVTSVSAIYTSEHAVKYVDIQKAITNICPVLSLPGLKLTNMPLFRFTLNVKTAQIKNHTIQGPIVPTHYANI